MRQRQRVINVTGEGNLRVKPDTIQIQLEVVTENKQLSIAQQENANVMNQVIESLLDLGIARENIQTTAFNIHSQYDYDEGRQEFRGYEVINTILVKITNIEQAGIIIDTAVRNGVNRVSNLQFSVENEQYHYQQALRLALMDAYVKAQTIAETMHLPLNPTPIKIVEEVREPAIAYRAFSVAEQNRTTPIEAGEITIRATVNVQFHY